MPIGSDGQNWGDMLWRPSLDKRLIIDVIRTQLLPWAVQIPSCFCVRNGPRAFAYAAPQVVLVPSHLSVQSPGAGYLDPNIPGVHNGPVGGRDRL